MRVERPLRWVVANARAVLIAAALLAVCGWALDSRIAIVSELQKLVPQSLAAVQDLDALQKETGTAGEIDVVVEGEDLTDPAVVRWMRDYQSAVLLRNGYNAEEGCAGAALCPALSLPDLFRTPELSATKEQVRALLDAVPPYLSQAAISPDRKTAVLAFGVRLQSLEAQRDGDRGDAGASEPARRACARRWPGCPVLAADANHAMSDPLRRLLVVVIGLAAVALALFAVYRSWERAWVPLVPIALATGWSALVLFLVGVPLNPMSAALSALVIAISTEFSVLAVGALPRGARGGLGAGRGVAAHVPRDRRGGARLGRDRDRRLRGADRVRRGDAARLRPRHRPEPGRVPGGRAGRAAGGARPGRARRARAAARTPGSSPPPGRRGVKRPGLLVVVFVGALLTFITFNTIITESEGSKGLQAGDAAPAVRDAVVDLAVRGPLRRERRHRRRPGRRRRAARVRGARARGAQRVRAARARARSSWRSCSTRWSAAATSSRCWSASPRGTRDVRSASSPCARTRPTRAGSGSSLPVGYDNDGAVANEYAVVVCPTITYVRRGGEIAGSTVGVQSEAQLDEWVRRIE